MKRLTCAILLITFLTACSGALPINVKKVASGDTTVKGIRYTVARPSYDVNIRFWWAKSQEKGKCVFTVSFAQNLKGQGIIYEIASKTNLTTSTNFSFTIGEDGQLTAFSGSETSGGKEFVEAVAGLATAVAAADVSPEELADNCATTNTKLAMYVRKQIGIEDGLAKLEGLLRDAYSSLPSSSVPRRDDIQLLEELRQEIAAQKTAAKEHRLKINPHVNVFIADRTNRVYPRDEVTDPWIEFVLVETL